MKSPKSGAPGAASTGPRSAAGKARSSMNALKSGIYSKSLIIPGEDPAQLETLLGEYFERYQPTVPEQRDLVDILVRSTWTLRRLAAAEAQILAHQMDRTYKLNAKAPLGHAFRECDGTLARLQRCINSTQKNFRDALHELERLRALGPATSPKPVETEPLKPPAEFVSLPYHRPGADCYFDPVDPTIYERCPLCFPTQS